MIAISISSTISRIVRRSAEWCPMCSHLESGCVCSTNQPVRDESSVLKFMQSPHASDGRNILVAATKHVVECFPWSGSAYTLLIALITDLENESQTNYIHWVADNTPRVLLDSTGLGYDYENQAWVMGGKYSRCGHQDDEFRCFCFGRIHEGENVRAAWHHRLHVA